MSAQEIIEQLPRLTAAELHRVRLEVEELAHRGQAGKPLSEALLEFAGVAEGLPTDMAENHDHYLHGVPVSFSTAGWNCLATGPTRSGR